MFPKKEMSCDSAPTPLIRPPSGVKTIVLNIILNIPILPMAFLTFAEAKVGSAPPFVPFQLELECTCSVPGGMCSVS